MARERVGWCNAVPRVTVDPLSSVLALSTGAEELQRVKRDANSEEKTALSADAPLIGTSRGKPQRVFAVSDGTVRGNEPDLFDTIVGDLDADGRAEIVVETEEGAVRVLKATSRD